MERIVRRDFPREQFNIVMTVLGDYGQRERLRVQLAALKPADGNLESLRRHIYISRQDYRDVLGPAEYPEYMKKGMFEAPKLPHQEQRRIIGEDWAQYEAWLRR